jgi:hypothetical protein
VTTAPHLPRPGHLALALALAACASSRDAPTTARPDTPSIPLTTPAPVSASASAIAPLGSAERPGATMSNSRLRLPQPFARVELGIPMTEAREVIGKGPKCPRYGEQINGFCAELATRSTKLDTILLHFDSVDDAHARVTADWPAPTAFGDVEVWTDEARSMHVTLAPNDRSAKLAVNAFTPLATLVGSTRATLLAGHNPLGRSPAEVRAAYKPNVRCPDESILCDLYLPACEYVTGDNTTVMLHLASASPFQVVSVSFTLSSSPDVWPAQLELFEQRWGKAQLDMDGSAKRSYSFPSTPDVTIEATSAGALVWIGMP